jgi:hypothetical protein
MLPRGPSNQPIETSAQTAAVQAGPRALAPWQARGIAGLRILFGFVWLIDAWFKWQPDFVTQFSNYLTGSPLARGRVSQPGFRDGSTSG